MRTSFLFAFGSFPGRCRGIAPSGGGGRSPIHRRGCGLLRWFRRRLAPLCLVVLDPVIDAAFLRLLCGVLPGHGSIRKTERGDRHGNHEFLLLMHAWYTMSPKDCAGSISLLLLFQLVSHA